MRATASRLQEAGLPSIFDAVTSLNPILIQELQTAPEPMQREVLDFLLFIKARRPQTRGITHTPQICGGDACVAGTRIPVWSLEQTRRLGFSEERILSNSPTLQREDLAAAWEYVRANPEEIEKAIALNEED